MITVIGSWDLAWYAPITEATLWQYALKEYDVDCWCMSPVSGIAAGVLILSEAAQMGTQLDDARAAGKTIVFVDEAGSDNLDDFVHPEDACYVLGRTSLSPFIAFSEPGDLSVQVVTAANLGGFWPHQALVVVLADRKRKTE